MVFTRHLEEVMAALYQLGNRPLCPAKCTTKDEKELSSQERKNCREALQSLLGKAPPGPGASGASRSPLSQASPCLRRLCGQLLSERLMQPNGVQFVLCAIQEWCAEGESDRRKCDSIARILAA
ncbi:transport and Golgi organization protein 6 homolog [Salvelinus alpinus]